MTLQPGTRIFLDRVAVPTRVGFADWERHPQRPTILNVSVDLFSIRTRWADPDGLWRLEHLIDYARVHDHLGGWATRPHTDSLEQLCQELADFCFADVQVNSVRVTIAKPLVFANAAGAGVEIFRFRDD